MSFFVDTKYLLFISSRLPQFKQKSNMLWNCRCIICGDSQKKKSKARGYFYRQRSDLFFKCHNCGASMHFGTFLKKHIHDEQLYNEYSFEKYAESKGIRTPHAKNPFDGGSSIPKSAKANFHSIVTNLSKLPDDHRAVKYCQNRQIPKDQLDRLYFCEDISLFKQLAPEYEDRLTGSESRLVIPFYDVENNLTGVTLRALGHSSLRYIALRLDPDGEQVFGLSKVDRSRPVYVTEGAIDSLFLDNAIACNGTAFQKLRRVGFEQDQLVLVFDNQPRNHEVNAIVERYIDELYSVVVWPIGLGEKDINEMVLVGRDPQKIVEQSVYKGLEAKLKFMEWKRQ